MNSLNDSKTPTAESTQGDSQAQPASATKPESKTKPVAPQASEFGGPKGLEPTRYGDWEKQGRCIDF